MNKFCTLAATAGGLLSLLLLAGCSAGSGEGSSLGGGEQAEDPVVVDYPVVYVRRNLNRDENEMLVVDDLYAPSAFNPGAELVLRDRATATAPERVLTEGLFVRDEAAGILFEGGYDVKDLAVSADGTQLAFAMRAPNIEGLDDDEQPSWNIWLYEFESAELKRVIASDLLAEEGDDIAPAFLPDGRIAFTSTRQRRSRALLLDDNKPQFSALAEDLQEPAFVLHVMEADGSAIQQISYNQSHDLSPTVLFNGRILFTRWDNMGGVDRLSLYTVKPDGSDLQFHYGYHSQATGTGAGTDPVPAAFARPQQMPDGRILVTLRAPEGITYGGDMVVIDAENFTEAYSEPEQQGVLQGQESLSVEQVIIDGGLSPHGLFANAWAFHDGTSRLLVSWSECRVIDPATELPQPCTDEWLATPDIVPADPLYGLWIYDYVEGTQRPIIQPVEGEMISEAVTADTRPVPEFIPQPIPGIDIDRDLFDEGMAVLDIRSVYDFDGTAALDIAALADPLRTTAAERPARFLRVVKAVGIPDADIRDFDRSAFGRNRSQLMREIIGYTPIQPDGSVRVKVPADMPLAISVVDANGRRIVGRHRNWLQFRAGEVRNCQGCHSRDSEVPHGRTDKEPESAWAGAPTSAAPFANTEPALQAQMGETMAQVLARVAGHPALEGDLLFTDFWTDPALRAKDPATALRISDLPVPEMAPTSLACQSEWTSTCRTVIHYQAHIQPIWDLPRQVTDVDGTVLEDHTCTACHTNRDAAGMTQVPPGQLDLRGDQSGVNNNFSTSYVELLFDNPTQELRDGAVQDVLVQDTDDDGNPLFETDENGELILDADGNPIPVMVTVNIQRIMNTNGANASRFFSIFEAGGFHEGALSAAELRLISEWLDIGAQYYNNPFEAPVD
ncbi:PD40 domain-containing protein [Microbulbifer salipaludis]|uniref:PD40 domain-containing protein n=1 Tax=Microbulbifer salipaludis TaxID=187980 RepID=A0ABS3E3D0_9GAMM|nr:PD40 domain-containing protein [Microbulbifer salipaludis]MBN8429796.1 PD40 domain-containing protein [Microbulbifer salipaludis]